MQHYRGITLLNLFKISFNILFNRLLLHTTKITSKYQCNIQRGKFTVDQINALRGIFEKTREYSINNNHLFIDFKAAFNDVRREKLYEAMTEFKILIKLINLLKATFNRALILSKLLILSKC